MGGGITYLPPVLWVRPIRYMLVLMRHCLESGASVALAPTRTKMSEANPVRHPRPPLQVGGRVSVADVQEVGARRKPCKGSGAKGWRPRRVSVGDPVGSGKFGFSEVDGCLEALTVIDFRVRHRGAITGLGESGKGTFPRSLLAYAFLHKGGWV